MEVVVTVELVIEVVVVEELVIGVVVGTSAHHHTSVTSVTGLCPVSTDVVTPGVRAT